MNQSFQVRTLAGLLGEEMNWWKYPVQWFGEKEIRVGSTRDGRQIRIFMRTIWKKTVVMRVDALCFRCGDWIEPNDPCVNIKDGSGVTRNRHEVCGVAEMV